MYPSIINNKNNSPHQQQQLQAKKKQYVGGTATATNTLARRRRCQSMRIPKRNKSLRNAGTGGTGTGGTRPNRRCMSLRETKKKRLNFEEECHAGVFFSSIKIEALPFAVHGAPNTTTKTSKKSSTVTTSLKPLLGDPNEQEAKEGMHPANDDEELALLPLPPQNLEQVATNSSSNEQNKSPSRRGSRRQREGGYTITGSGSDGHPKRCGGKRQFSSPFRSKSRSHRNHSAREQQRHPCKLVLPPGHKTRRQPRGLPVGVHSNYGCPSNYDSKKLHYKRKMNDVMIVRDLNQERIHQMRLDFLYGNSEKNNNHKIGEPQPTAAMLPTTTTTIAPTSSRSTMTTMQSTMCSSETATTSSTNNHCSSNVDNHPPGATAASPQTSSIVSENSAVSEKVIMDDVDEASSSVYDCCEDSQCDCTYYTSSDYDSDDGSLTVESVMMGSDYEDDDEEEEETEERDQEDHNEDEVEEDKVSETTSDVASSIVSQPEASESEDTSSIVSEEHHQKQTCTKTLVGSPPTSLHRPHHRRLLLADGDEEDDNDSLKKEVEIAVGGTIDTNDGHCLRNNKQGQRGHINKANCNNAASGDSTIAHSTISQDGNKIINKNNKKRINTHSKITDTKRGSSNKHSKSPNSRPKERLVAAASATRTRACVSPHKPTKATAITMAVPPYPQRQLSLRSPRQNAVAAASKNSDGVYVDEEDDPELLRRARKLAKELRRLQKAKAWELDRIREQMVRNRAAVDAKAARKRARISSMARRSKDNEEANLQKAEEMTSSVRADSARIRAKNKKILEKCKNLRDNNMIIFKANQNLDQRLQTLSMKQAALNQRHRELSRDADRWKRKIAEYDEVLELVENKVRTEGTIKASCQEYLRAILRKFEAKSGGADLKMVQSHAIKVRKQYPVESLLDAGTSDQHNNLGGCDAADAAAGGLRSNFSQQPFSSPKQRRSSESLHEMLHVQHCASVMSRPSHVSEESNTDSEKDVSQHYHSDDGSSEEEDKSGFEDDFGWSSSDSEVSSSCGGCQTRLLDDDDLALLTTKPVVAIDTKEQLMNSSRDFNFDSHDGFDLDDSSSDGSVDRCETQDQRPTMVKPSEDWNIYNDGVSTIGYESKNGGNPFEPCDNEASSVQFWSMMQQLSTLMIKNNQGSSQMHLSDITDCHVDGNHESTTAQLPKVKTVRGKKPKHQKDQKKDQKKQQSKQNKNNVAATTSINDTTISLLDAIATIDMEEPMQELEPTTAITPVIMQNLQPQQPRPRSPASRLSPTRLLTPKSVKRSKNKKRATPKQNQHQEATKSQWRF